MYVNDLTKRMTEQQSKQETSSKINFMNDNRSMLHTFWGEMSRGQYIYQRICINFCVHHNFLLLIIKCKRKSILRPTHPTILIFRLQPAIVSWWYQGTRYQYHTLNHIPGTRYDPWLNHAINYRRMYRYAWYDTATNYLLCIAPPPRLSSPGTYVVSKISYICTGICKKTLLRSPWFIFPSTCP